MTAGLLLREARHRHHVSQERLARRAGTTQSAISRIERDQVSPTVETLSNLLFLLGEELELSAREADHGHDRTLLHLNLDADPSERLARGAAFATAVARNRGLAHRPPAERVWR